MNIHASILDTIGNTPLIRVPGLSNSNADIVLKLEFFNPLGSVKDRIGKAMIEDAEKRGVLKSGMRIIEPTSGNTGIGLAMVAAAKGYKITLTMPETMSMERRSLLLLLGADVVITPAALGMRGAIAKAMQMVASDTNAVMMEQFDNPANPAIHAATTAQEIWRDTDGKVDFVISGVGTGGTLSGIGKALKAKKPSIHMVAVEPEESPVISGGKGGPHKIMGIGAGFIPNTLDRAMIDSIEKISSAESLSMARTLIQKHGIPVGISSGAAVAAALRVAQRADSAGKMPGAAGKMPSAAGKMIVVIIPSYTERYLSTVLAEAERTQASALVVSEPSAEFLEQAGKRYGI